MARENAIFKKMTPQKALSAACRTVQSQLDKVLHPVPGPVIDLRHLVGRDCRNGVPVGFQEGRSGMVAYSFARLTWPGAFSCPAENL
ncbi:MAG: hypothetical protein ACAI35_20050, partial [Candidatus Methylacidiphilales bacterium]